MSQELSDTHPDIRSICCRSFREMAEVLRHDLKEAKAKYAPGSAIDPQSLAEHFVVVLEGTMLVAKVMPKATGKGSGLDHYKQYLKALLSANFCLRSRPTGWYIINPKQEGIHERTN